MRFQLAFLLTLALCLRSDAFATPPTEDTCRESAVAEAATAQTSSSVRARGDSVPFDLYRNFLIVLSGTLGGSQPRRFLLDTGAVPTIIDSSVARELGLEGRPGKVALLTGDVPDLVATVAEIALGPIHRCHLRAGVRDLSFIQRELGVRVDAVIGLDVLRAANFTIDYAARRLWWGPTEAPSHSAAFATDPPPFITVDARIQGRTFRLLLDTGTSGLKLFRNRVGDLKLARLAAGIVSQNMAGPLPLERVWLEGIEFGGVQLAGQIASIVEDRGASRGEFDGLLGLSTLNARRVTFDFERHLIAWESRQEAPRREAQVRGGQ